MSHVASGISFRQLRGRRRRGALHRAPSWTAAARMLTLFALSLLLLVAGCSSGEPTYPVRGKITYQGETVSGGAINFFPAQGKLLGGAIGEDGTYAFDLPAGDYRVAINAPPPVPADWKEGDPVPQTEAPIPPQYARPDSSGLTLTISPSDAPLTHDFELP